MSINYKQLQEMVKEAMFTGGGINEPSAPVGIPHRMPAADTSDREQDMGDPDANKMYDLALAAREAVEKLVEALDEPIYDGAYEQAFKASACMRRALNSLEQSGAHPMPDQRVVAQPPGQQKYTGGSQKGAGDYAGGSTIGANFAMSLEEDGFADALDIRGPGEELINAWADMKPEEKAKIQAALGLGVATET